MKQSKIIECIECSEVIGCLNFYYSISTLCEACIFNKIFGCYNVRRRNELESVYSECNNCKGENKNERKILTNID